ncbi:arsenic resistance protein [Tsukamurella hominis]|uniref:arsenic resistance protein n=1 Tax=Tsukamurella hominis TaxID=1970232 RepID=UPI0039E7B535
MRSAAGWAEDHQVPLYVAGLVLGAALGLAVPTVAGPAEAVINPVLALLLYATFLGIPFARMGEALRDVRFLGTVLAVNFVAVPVVVFALSRIVAHDRVLLVGVLFVLLTPCVDYVIVFSGLAGGAKDRLLAAAPLLMLVQMVLLPVYLWLFVGADVVRTVEFGPFAEAFVWVIVVPLLLAGATQWAAARTRWGATVASAVTDAMVPVMVLTLAVVVASQIAGVRDQLSSLLLAVPVYVLFAAVMTPVGAAAGRLAGLDVPGRRSVVFSGVTRNSLVILPLVLALPAEYALAPLVVVTQTLVELVVMVLFVRLIPRLIR